MNNIKNKITKEDYINLIKNKYNKARANLFNKKDYLETSKFIFGFFTSFLVLIFFPLFVIILHVNSKNNIKNFFANFFTENQTIEHAFFFIFSILFSLSLLTMLGSMMFCFFKKRNYNLAKNEFETIKPKFESMKDELEFDNKEKFISELIGAINDLAISKMQFSLDKDSEFLKFLLDSDDQTLNNIFQGIIDFKIEENNRDIQNNLENKQESTLIIKEDKEKGFESSRNEKLDKFNNLSKEEKYK